jgi:TusA-related sulfurtransferase
MHYGLLKTTGSRPQLKMGGKPMETFKTIDIRGLSFFNALQLAAKEFNRVKKNGILELIIDKKRDLTSAMSRWAENQGCKISDIEDDPRMVRLFIRKGSQAIKA